MSSAYRFGGGFPTAEAIDAVREDDAVRRAVEVYRFFYPLVSMDGLMRGTIAAGGGENQAVMVLESEPRHVVFTANSDTPYGGASCDLSKTRLARS